MCVLFVTYSRANWLQFGDTYSGYSRYQGISARHPLRILMSFKAEKEGQWMLSFFIVLHWVVRDNETEALCIFVFVFFFYRKARISCNETTVSRERKIDIRLSNVLTLLSSVWRVLLLWRQCTVEKKSTSFFVSVGMWIKKETTLLLVMLRITERT